MDFHDLIGLELRDDKKPIESVAKGGVGNGLENEGDEFAAHKFIR
jgi:hypothetical protein